MFIGIGLFAFVCMTMVGCDKEIKEAVKPAPLKIDRVLERANV